MINETDYNKNQKEIDAKVERIKRQSEAFTKHFNF